MQGGARRRRRRGGGGGVGVGGAGGRRREGGGGVAVVAVVHLDEVRRGEERAERAVQPLGVRGAQGGHVEQEDPPGNKGAAAAAQA